MIDEKKWEQDLKDLNLDDLKQLSKIINKLKKTFDEREEFIDVLKRWQKKYPGTKYFYSGGAGKGAYESSGDWWTNDWYEVYNMEEVFDIKDYENWRDHGDVDILDEFETFEDFKKSIINFNILNYDNDGDKNSSNEFSKEMNKSKHVPKNKLTDAEDLCNGDNTYKFINIETGETKTIVVTEWG